MLRYLIAAGVFILSNASLFAQGPPPPPGGPPCWPPPCIPIDGGASFLIAAGVAYAGKKMYDVKKNKSQKQAE